MTHRSFLLAALLVLASQAHAQIATLSPEQPRWGQPITLTYDPAAANAVLTARDDVYAYINWAYENGAYEEHHTKLALRDGKFTGEITVPQGARAATVFFMTPQAYDKNVRLTPIFYREDGMAARGAHASFAFNTVPRADSLLAEEWRLYPDNWAAYQTRWQLASFVRASELDSLVRADMAHIEKVANGKPDDLLYALSYGHLYLADESAARAALTQLAEQYPDSPYLASAFSNYQYQVFRQQIKGDGPEAVKAMQRKLVIAYPSSAFARENVSALTYVGEGETVPLDVVQAVVKPWIAEQPENPMPYYYYGLATLRAGKDLDTGADHMAKALALMLANKLRFYGDFSGFRTEMTLPSAYQFAAQLAQQQKDWGNALGYATMAQELQSDKTDGPYLLEGEIWEELGHGERAESAYVAAHLAGSKTAEEKLRALYEKQHGTTSGFDAHFAALTDAAVNAGDKPAAPVFTTSALDGAALNLDALRGKIVVLNFWFIGCAPCIVEMPGLNELVAEYAGQDVVFIAFALDGEEDLHAFLEEKAFDYQIVASANDVAEQYGVESYPTHIIINRDGKIEATLTGGSETRHEDLRPFITRLLK